MPHLVWFISTKRWAKVCHGVPKRLNIGWRESVILAHEGSGRDFMAETYTALLDYERK